jgi:hypothetical protein
MPRSTAERPPLSPAVRDTFDHWKRGDLLNSLEASYRQLLDRRKNVVEVAEQHEPGKHTASNCLVLQQALLHRAERLIAACGSMLLENNVYALALIVRGHYETTGILGYLCNRLNSLKEGKIKFEEFAYNAARAVLGAKHSQFTKAPNPPNILTCIKKADSYLDTHYLKEKKGMLTWCAAVGALHLVAALSYQTMQIIPNPLVRLALTM